MGVQGLWQLIESSGKPIPIEVLENKILAIDISLWLNQAVKGYQDSKGHVLPNAHLLGLFNRLCKLLFYKIKPIFVFDGQCPSLKQQTIAKRSEQKNKHKNEADRIEKLLLESLANEKIVQQALGTSTSLLVSPIKKNPTPEKEDIFKLPSIKEKAPISDDSSTDLTDLECSFDEPTYRNYYQNLHSIDVNSSNFKNLPPDVRLEILTDMKELRKQSSWSRLHELPAKSNDFSSFQMNRLLKRRQVQVSLEEAEQEVGGKVLSMGELELLLKEEGVEIASNISSTKTIVSDENTRFILVRDLKKAMEEAEKNKNKPSTTTSKLHDVPSTSKYQAVNEVIPSTSDEQELDSSQEICDAYNEDLQMAIRMSLQKDTTITNDIDSDIEIINDDEDEGEVKMSVEQKKLLSGAAMSLARGYMMEYAGMSNEDVTDLLNYKRDENVINNNESFIYNDTIILNGESKQESKIPNNEMKIKNTTNSIKLIDSDSDSDSEFIDVPDDDFNGNDNIEVFPIHPMTSDLQDTKDLTRDFRLEHLELFIKPVKEEDLKDDIFADIFTSSNDNVKIESKDEQTIPIEKTKLQSMMVEFKIPIIEKVESLNKSNEISEEKKNLISDILEKLNKEKENISKLNLDSINIELPNKMVNDDVKVDDVENKIAVSESDSNKIEETEKIIVKDDSSNTLQISQNSDETIIYETPKKNIVKISLDEILKEKTDQNEIENKTILDEAKICSDNDSVIINENKSNDIIEILDDDSIISGNKNYQKQSSNINAEKKQTNLDSYFLEKGEKTPEKNKNSCEKEPKIAQPFFVNRSPKSNKKENSVSNQNGTTRKSLFGNYKDTSNLIETQQEIQKTAVDILKETKTTAELQTMALQLSQDNREMVTERNKQQRFGTSITARMHKECKDLLKLFGIPYIMSPMEAEAQCAFLNEINMTDGTITDDSDIWLFGGKTVYKNFFNQKKYVMEFTINNIENLFNVDRKKLIQLALLVGSDYTTGVNGVGAVTAMEILATFPTTPEKDNETNEKMSMLSGLRKFRDWMMNGKSVGPGGKTVLRSKLKNVVLTEGFPQFNIVDAYLHPTIDESREPFAWGNPDIDMLRDYAKKKFGWTTLKSDEILLPVFKRLDEKKSQKTIKSYFKIQRNVTSKMASPNVSKRVKNAIRKMDVNYKSDDDDDEKTSPNKKPKLKKKIVKKSTKKVKGKKCNNLDDDDDVEIVELNTTIPPPSQSNKIPAPIKKITETVKSRKRGAAPKTSQLISKINSISSSSLTDGASTSSFNVKVPRIPNGNQKIPQREKSEEEMENNKQKAIDLFKKIKK